ncbi:hypothetical protein [Streptomyces niveus]|uniref:hypothetical protein n=1 Tax=Streptomyces niveus TaxID=193462 RepID=UPI0003C63495|nr:hypothetical protein [Streptomyces niveus]EST17894.1 hypothetical protein M877_40000 [Streptomyces niveus NCIMB 11891]
MSHHLEPRPYTSADYLAGAPLTGAVQLHGERQEHDEAVVWVPDAYGRMMPVRRSQADALLAAVPVTAPRDLSPQPLVDSRAQVVLAAGVGTGAAAAGVGYGLGQVLAPLAAIGSSGVLWALALLAVLGTAGRRSSQTTNTYVTNHVQARWWGKSSASTRN